LLEPGTSRDGHLPLEITLTCAQNTQYPGTSRGLLDVCENAILEFRSEVPVTRYLVFGVHGPQIPVILNWWRLRTKVSLFGYQVVPGSPRYWGMGH
jgi:hypothetical protein